MAKESQRININIRGSSPCRDCSERFTACSDRCPKDQRGEYGYKAWKQDVQAVKETRKSYLQEWYQDYNRRTEDGRPCKRSR